MTGLTRAHAQFSLINDGSVRWPSDVELVSISGVTEGLHCKVSPLSPGQVRDLELPIDAPKLSGTYESVWRLATSENGIRRCFGPKISLMLRIQPNPLRVSPSNSRSRKSLKSMYEDQTALVCTQ